MAERRNIQIHLKFMIQEIGPDITAAVGLTPLIRLKKKAGEVADIFAKCEFCNPLGSIKDRVGLAMIEAAEKDGILNSGTHIIEPTSGNTGIALAFICSARGYRLTLTMPESMSEERKKLLIALGASLVLTPAADGMEGAILRAKQLAGDLRDCWLPQQFENPANPAVHEATTGPEIWASVGGDIDAVVAGVGTGGTITGVARYFKSKKPGFKAIAVEPMACAVISGRLPGSHKIQGIGAGFIPKNLDLSLLDDIIQVKDDNAFETSRWMMKEEGILAGISSGANVWAARQAARRPEFKGKKIVTFLCSTGERYLSTKLF